MLLISKRPVRIKPSYYMHYAEMISTLDYGGGIVYSPCCSSIKQIPNRCAEQ